MRYPKDNIPTYELREPERRTEEEKPEKISTIHVCLSFIKWGGESYDSAKVFIDHCCQESIDRCEELFLHNTTVRDPEKFAKMVYKGNVVDNCPFCGAKYVYVQEKVEDRELWY